MNGGERLDANKQFLQLYYAALSHVASLCTVQFIQCGKQIYSLSLQLFSAQFVTAGCLKAVHADPLILRS